MATNSEGRQARYEAYLERFAAQAGLADVGEFVKHNDLLVKKLGAEEFDEAFEEFRAMTTQYLESVDRGDTINDQVVRLIRRRATELFVASPV